MEIGNRVCCVVYVVGLSTAWIIRGQVEKKNEEGPISVWKRSSYI